MLQPFLFVILMSFWLSHELGRRKVYGRKPANLREFYIYCNKRTSPDPRATALIFALLTTMMFAIWESILAFLFDHSVPSWISVGGLVPFFVELHLRRRNFSEEGPKLGFSSLDFYLIYLFTIAFMGSRVAVLLIPWIFWRSRFLKTPRLAEVPEQSLSKN